MATVAGASSHSTPPRQTSVVHGVKRSHAAMADQSVSPLFTPTSTPSPSQQSHRANIVLPPLEPSIISESRRMPPPNSVRMTSNSHNRQVPSDDVVVDLTGDDEEEQEQDVSDMHVNGARSRHSDSAQRMPRFPAEIIDLSSDSSPNLPREVTPIRRPSEDRRPAWRVNRRPPSLVREGSSDIAFVSEAQHPERQPTRYTRFREAQSSLFTPTPSPSPPRRTARSEQRFTALPHGEVTDLTNSEDEVVFIRQRVNPNRPPTDHSGGFGVAETRDRLLRAGANFESNQESGLSLSLRSAFGNFPNLTQIMNNLAGRSMQPPTLSSHSHQPPPGHTNRSAPRNPFMAQMPQMDYAAVGFGFASSDWYGGRTEAPKYEPPPAAEHGFTRTPVEGEEVVCPACGDELTTGETEEKKQVWVIKGCGHVYCGECMANRKKTAKGKGRSSGNSKLQHFSECLVDGCKVKVSQKTSVIQIFL